MMKMMKMMALAFGAAAALDDTSGTRCAHTNCLDWDCAEWCECYDETKDDVYANAGCAAGEDTCTCSETSLVAKTAAKPTKETTTVEAKPTLTKAVEAKKIATTATKKTATSIKKSTSFTVPPGTVLFKEDFEHGLGGWKGKNGAAKPETAMVGTDPSNSGNHVLRMHGCIGGGDAFSVAEVACSHEHPCLVSYRTRGRAWQGFSTGYAATHIWSVTPTDYSGSFDDVVHVKTTHDIHNWHKVEYVFPQANANFVHGDSTTKITTVHMMLEAYQVDCKATMFDDIVIKRYAGSQAQATAINAAVNKAH